MTISKNIPLFHDSSSISIFYFQISLFVPGDNIMSKVPRKEPFLPPPSNTLTALTVPCLLPSGQKCHRSCNGRCWGPKEDQCQSCESKARQLQQVFTVCLLCAALYPQAPPTAPCHASYSFTLCSTLFSALAGWGN